MNGIDRVVPVNEAHRKRLEEMRARFQEIQDRTSAELAMMRVEDEHRKERLAGVKELAGLRSANDLEIRDALFAGQGEQVGLIRRIAGKV